MPELAIKREGHYVYCTIVQREVMGKEREAPPGDDVKKERLQDNMCWKSGALL